MKPLFQKPFKRATWSFPQQSGLFDYYFIDAMRCPAKIITATPTTMMVPPKMVAGFGRSPKKRTAPMIDDTGNRSRKGIA